MAVRHERVILELEDNFTTGMARAAASAALLNRELNSLSRDSVRTRSAVSDIDRPIQQVGRSSGTTGREVDRLSGRMRILADVAAILGPSLVPIGAVGIPAITGLAAQLGFAATAGATAILAFQGVGNALRTLNAAALNPTTQNLEKAQVALEGLSPQAQEFVAQIGHMIPQLKQLRDVAAAGMFPGLTEGLRAMETGLPHVRDVIGAVSTELGAIGRNAGVSLASERWTDFLDFVAREAPSALGDMATAAGHTAHAVAALWMATDPLNDDFSTWLVNATADIDRWASSLAKTQGFADFVAYVESTGPQVADTLGAIANAAIQIVQATAPLGGPVLKGIEALANLVASIADSDLGTPIFGAVAALALFNRTMAIGASIQKSTLFGATRSNFSSLSSGIRGITADLAALNRQSLRAPAAGFIGPLTEAQTARKNLSGTLVGIGKATALMGGLAIASTGAADKIGLTNAMSGALIGTLAGPWGAAVGGAAGLLLDASKAGGQFADSMKRADAAMRTASVGEMTNALRDLEQQQEVQRSSGAAVGRAQAGVAIQMAATSRKVDELKTKIRFERERAETGLLRDGFEATADGIDDASTATANFKAEFDKLNAVLTGRATFRDFEQSILDFQKRAADRAKALADLRKAQDDLAGAKTPEERQAARQRIKDLRDQADALKYSLDVSTQAGIDTQDLLDNIATTALKVGQGIVDPVKRTEFLAGARTAYIKAAIEAGHAKDEAKALADEVLGLSTVKGVPVIKVNAQGAWRVIDETEARLERLTRKTRRINITAQAGSVQSQIASLLADRGGFALGGWTGPGAKFQPAGVVHADEFVFSKEATNGNVAFLTALHNRMRGYADGGLVQRFPAQPVMSSPGLSDSDVTRIAGALLAARPIFGDVHLSGDGSFEREQRMRLSSLDGVPR